MTERKHKLNKKKSEFKLLGQFQIKNECGDFPGDPVVKILPSNAGDAGLTPDGGSKIPHVLRPKKPKHKIEAVL